jgi:hypothetical protein
MSDPRHPMSIAFDAFKEKRKSSFDASTLGNQHPDYYLENRLWSAFCAGWDAHEKQELKESKSEKKEDEV